MDLGLMPGTQPSLKKYLENMPVSANRTLKKMSHLPTEKMAQITSTGIKAVPLSVSFNM